MSGLPKYLQELKELETKATPGPWVMKESGYSLGVENGPNYLHITSLGIYKEEQAQFIAKSRNALPRILKEYAAMKEALEFYADKENHVTGESWVAPNVLISKGQTDDLGNKASEVLEAIERDEHE